MSSVETTTASEQGLFCSSSAARSTDRSEAEQPWPERLKVRQLERKPNRLEAIAQREGVGEKREQLMIRKSTCFGFRPVLSKSRCSVEQMTVSASCLAATIVWSCCFVGSSHCRMPGGHAVASPVPELPSTLAMNSRSGSSYDFIDRPMLFISCTSSACDFFHSSGGSKSEKSSR